MSQLKIFLSKDPSQVEMVAQSNVSQCLADIGVRFERWQASAPLNAESSQEEVLAAYSLQVEALKDEYGFQSADVISLRPDHPDKEVLRAKFLDEHIHTDFEVRFFVEGKGLFYIHADDKVYGVMCEGGDLISVPANAKHWFDMGPQPDFKCIRLFTTPEGWVAQYSGDDIANNFPRFDEF